MIIFVHQPEYMPWLGFFDKLARCDTFVIYDDAQFQHGGFHNRNKIRTAQGWKWLTVPITHGHPQTLKDVKIAGTQWKNKHISTITHNYEKTPYFKEYFPLIKEAIDFDHELLIGLNLHLIRTFAEILSIKVNIVRSSEFPYCGKEKNEKLVSMCRSMGLTRICQVLEENPTLTKTCSHKPTLRFNGTTTSTQFTYKDTKAFNLTCQS
jgi:hypothetical protein